MQITLDHNRTGRSSEKKSEGPVSLRYVNAVQTRI